jgi:phospholipid/cholesterol/gamma-HCH transport system substrate-binding protein
MENRSHALIAGLFALLLGLSAVAALWWFGGKKEATNQYVVVTKKTITGLNLQAQVRYRGIRVGKVETIELDPHDFSNILIGISVDRNIPVTRGTTAKLGYQGITGIAHVLLEDSGKDTQSLEGENGELPRILMQDSLMQELSDVGGETLRNARDLLDKANDVLSPENRQSISRSLANLEVTTARLSQLLAPENVRVFSSTLVKTEQAVGQAGPFFAEARDLVSSLKSASEKLNATLDASSGDGIGALLPRLNDLADELGSSSRQLNRVLQNVEDSPQSLIFGRQNALPGPGEAGFVAPMPSRE